MIKLIKNADLNRELLNIGFDKSYVHCAKDKYEFLCVKIFSMTAAQANILKQTALSVGTDCAVHRDVVTGKAEISDCILGGSVSQLKKITEKLKHQPFSLSKIALEIENICNFNPQNQTKIVGILNLTPDSFSDGGKFLELDNAKKHIFAMIEQGVDVIDIGAESTKPFSDPVSDEIQLERLIPVLQFINDEKISIPISIDTRSSVVAQKCIELGASIINDVSGFDYDDEMVNVIAQNSVKIVIQHSKGSPETMQISPKYDNLMDEIFVNLKNKIEFAVSKGIKQENIIIDAGIGFGKFAEDNFEIINRAEELKTLGCPLMLGISRKSLLNAETESNDLKDAFTLALNAIAVERKVDYLRVHNVGLNKKLLELMKGF